ncbi:hypothetical protein [Oricola sp.]
MKRVVFLVADSRVFGPCFRVGAENRRSVAEKRQFPGGSMEMILTR